MNKWNWGRRLLCCVPLLAAFVPGVGRADSYTYTFHPIPAKPDGSFNSGATNAWTVASQLTAEVTSVGMNQVLFTFHNNVGLASSITDVYLDDGALLSVASISHSSGVSFSSPAHPPDLSGGNNVNPPFQTTKDLSADSDSPVTANGVNSANEWLGITFNLKSGKVFADVIAALQQAVDGTTDSGEIIPGLRIGLHVQSIGTGATSDAFVNNPGHVSVPGAVLLGLLGLGAAGVRLHRFA